MAQQGVTKRKIRDRRTDSLVTWDEDLAMPGKVVAHCLKGKRRPSVYPVAELMPEGNVLPIAELVDAEEGLGSYGLQETNQSYNGAHNQAVKMGMICTAIIGFCLFVAWNWKAYTDLGLILPPWPVK